MAAEASVEVVLDSVQVWELGSCWVNESEALQMIERREKGSNVSTIGSDLGRDTSYWDTGYRKSCSLEPLLPNNVSRRTQILVGVRGRGEGVLREGALRSGSS